MYWPNKGESIIFGDFTIEYVSDKPESRFIKHTLKVTNAKEVDSLLYKLSDQNFIVINRNLYLELLYYCNIRTGRPNHVLRIQLILLI